MEKVCIHCKKVYKKTLKGKAWENQKYCTISCGVSARNAKHGMTNTPFYKVFKTMQNRCNRTNHISYPRYGGVGIKCLWVSFEDFRDDMYESYLEAKKKTGKTTIDRLDNTDNYCKENCRWVDYKTQARNKGNNRLLTFNNETLCLAEWAESLGVNQTMLHKRLKRGWNVEQTLTC